MRPTHHQRAGRPPYASFHYFERAEGSCAADLESFWWHRHLAGAGGQAGKPLPPLPNYHRRVRFTHHQRAGRPPYASFHYFERPEGSYAADLESFWWHRHLAGAGAQAGKPVPPLPNYHRRVRFTHHRRAGRPPYGLAAGTEARPTDFSCFTGGSQAHKQLGRPKKRADTQVRPYGQANIFNRLLSL